jgi:ABC-2 type transport system permease protein
MAMRANNSSLIRGELRKISRDRGSQWLTALAIFLVVLAGVGAAGDTGITQLARQRPQEFVLNLADVMRIAVTTGLGVLVLVGSARLVAMEYGGGTIRVVLARGVGRVQLVVAKAAALVLAGGLVLALLSILGVVLGCAVVVKQTGGMHALTVLDAAAWRGMAVDLLVAVVSLFVCVLLGVAAGASRSMAVAVAAAVGFFPVDNGLVPFLSVLSDATGKRVWNDLTGYLLGPTLNHLPTLLSGRHVDIEALAPPSTPTTIGHGLAVVAVYCAVLVVVAVVPTWRRDVLE